MNIIRKNINELSVAERNVRRHPETQIKELQRSYQMFGQYRPLVVNAEGIILVGNGMYTALKELGVEEVDCVVLPPNTSQEYQNKLMLADNKVFELGANNLDNIDALMKELENFEIPGFDEATLTALYAEAEEVLEAIDDMFVVPEERKEVIQNVAEKREATPTPVSAAPSSPATSGSAAEKQKIEHEGSYVTCPHCGMKIWVS